MRGLSDKTYLDKLLSVSHRLCDSQGGADLADTSKSETHFNFRLSYRPVCVDTCHLSHSTSLRFSTPGFSTCRTIPTVSATCSLNITTSWKKVCSRTSLLKSGQSKSTLTKPFWPPAAKFFALCSKPKWKNPRRRKSKFPTWTKKPS